MPRFHYTVVNEFMDEEVDASFLSDEELVGDLLVEHEGHAPPLFLGVDAFQMADVHGAVVLT